MSRPKLLDLFCGAGGAAMGYIRAGFDVTGVDNVPQPDYPGTFILGDALDYLAENWRGFDAGHASPPCQASTALTKGTNKGRQYAQLIPETRRLLKATGLPSIIENVQGSDLRRDVTAHKPHRGRVRGWRHGVYYDGPYVAVYGQGGGKGTVPEWQQAMGIHWTDDRKAIAEAIPPLFTDYIGSELMRHLRAEVAA